ncbi:hypothetical protein [Nocardia terpenica]|uniref:hypothetical protein n=1 Tax=Nocardia terpenica TaxID=455432 RepID=UPI000AFB669A|nr:hypothetical protein [Nocardia terpenica]NQE85996.1 hypothetical protein [Nocardia terpenica]
MTGTSLYSNRTIIRASAVLCATAAVVTACANQPGQPTASPSAPTTTARPKSPYPPVTFTWDFAVPLTGQEEAAARFAAETAMADDQFMWADHYEPDLERAYNERVTRTYIGSRSSWEATQSKWPATGGMLWRVVGTTPAEDGYRVTLCQFDTPGTYSLIDDKLVKDPGNRSHAAEALTVVSTTKPSAADPYQTPAPRTLVTAIEPPGAPNESPSVHCDKFAPEPFVQTPPPPITPAPGQK